MLFNTFDAVESQFLQILTNCILYETVSRHTLSLPIIYHEPLLFSLSISSFSHSPQKEEVHYINIWSKYKYLGVR